MGFFINNVDIQKYQSSFYVIGDGGGFMFDLNKNFILGSNEFYYLINCDPEQRIRQAIPKLESSAEFTFVDEIVVPLITSFSTGVHAYSGIYSILLNYFNKIEGTDCKFIVHEGLQKGVLDVITKMVGESRIIILEKNTLYRFREIILIPNSLHSFLESKSISLRISDFIHNHLLEERKDNPKKIAILKTEKSSVSSIMGIMSDAAAQEFCKRNEFEIIEPSDIGELNTISVVANCEQIVFSWGTTFMKNYIYLSEKCKRADVIIFGDDFRREFENAIERDIIIRKFRNCEFFYHLNKNITEIEI